MATEWMDSWRGYSSAADLALKYTVNGTPVIAAGGRFSGNSECQFNSTGGSGDKLTKVLTAKATRIVNCPVKFDQIGTAPSQGIIQFLDGATLHVDIRINSSGNLYATRNGTTIATGARVLSAEVWYGLEIKVTVDDAAGRVILYIDGSATPEIDFTGDTRNAGNASSDRIAIQTWVTGRTCSFDHIIIMNTDGALYNDFIGDKNIQVLRPTGAGNYSQFTPSAGSNYQNVDDTTPDGDTTYNETDVLNEIDTFAFGDLSAPGAVGAMQLSLYHRRTDAGPRGLSPLLRISATDYVGTEITESATFTFDSQIYDTNPNTSAAWTEAGINALEAGYKMTT